MDHSAWTETPGFHLGLALYYHQVIFNVINKHGTFFMDFGIFQFSLKVVGEASALPVFTELNAKPR